MPVQIQTVQVTPGSSAKVSFSGQQVETFVYGIQNFLLTYGDDDHKVETMSISVDATLSGDTVLLDVTGVLSDDDGHKIDRSDSYVVVTVVAVVTAVEPDVIFNVENGIMGEGQPLSVNETFSVNQSLSMVAGFDISYGSTDHKVESVSFDVGTEVSQQGHNVTVTPTVTANITDDSGHSASSPSVDVAMILTSADASSPLVQVCQNQQTTDTVSIDFGQDLAACGAMLQSFTVAYAGTDHRVRTIGGGTPCCAVDSKDSTKVNIERPHSFMSDQDTEHYQSDSLSSVTLVVFGIPSSSFR